MRWMLAFLFIPGLAYGLPSLDELKSHLTNNIEIQTKQQEIKAYRSSSSIFNNIRAAASYNFETQSSFYGLIASIPINTLTLRGKEIAHKKLELQQLIQEKEKEIEGLYYTWLDHQDLLPIREMEVKEKEREVERKRILLDHEKIDPWTLSLVEKEYHLSVYELNGLKRDIQEVESQIKRLVGLE